MRLGLRGVLLFLAILGTVVPVRAQPIRDSNALGWYAYIGRHRMVENWDIHMEGQWRRSDVILGWQQLLVRPALVYSINRRWSVAGG